MAVVFISPKQRQKTFFVIITLMFLLFMIVIFLGVFSAKPSSVSQVVVFNKAKINIDMSIFNGEKFKNLQPFTDINPQYSYSALFKNGKPQSGFISAPSIDQARTMLEGMGLNVSEISEVEAGRPDPFIPYYQEPVVAPVAGVIITKDQPTK
jgi:hypothetical protein